MNDLESLRQYVVHGSHDAFADLVTRYLPLVYTAARRQVRSPYVVPRRRTSPPPHLRPRSPSPPLCETDICMRDQGEFVSRSPPLSLTPLYLILVIFVMLRGQLLLHFTQQSLRAY